MAATNLHATALLLGDRGVLITGASGAGKTTLALALLDHFSGKGSFARLVSDDQVLVRATAGRVICQVPPTLAGLVEVFGLGPRQIDHEAQMVVDVLVQLVPAREAERFPEPATEHLAGCEILCLRLPAGHAQSAIHVIASWVSCAPLR